MRFVTITLALYLAVIDCSGGDSFVTATVAGDVSVSFHSRQSGTHRWSGKTIRFPKGCEYVAHDVALVERTPKSPNEIQAPDPRHYFRDRLMHNRRDRVSALDVGVRAHRPFDLGPGPALTTIRVSVTVRCDSALLEKFRKQFD